MDRNNQNEVEFPQQDDAVEEDFDDSEFMKRKCTHPQLIIPCSIESWSSGEARAIRCESQEKEERRNTERKAPEIELESGIGTEQPSNN